MNLRAEALKIMETALATVQPETAVCLALKGLRLQPEGKLLLLAVGKAAWKMARAAQEELPDKISSGLVLTKYGYLFGPLPGLTCLEAGHPVPDAQSCAATDHALQLVQNLTSRDTVLFLLSGGGSALLEKPLVSLAELQNITQQLLNCGADIRAINTIRKRLSAVKGGRLALACAPAHVFTVVLSDIPGDPLDMIASGPAYPDSSTCAQAVHIAQKYHLQLSAAAWDLLHRETPKSLANVETHITGNVQLLATAAAAACTQLGYQPRILTTTLEGEAQAAGRYLAALAREQYAHPQNQAFICGGETVVKVTGTGRGGRNQEIALSAAAGIAGLRDTAIFSFSSDGTDGPTDAAGGFVDGSTAARLQQAGLDPAAYLRNHDSYHALKKIGALLQTGPTGTNVNDLSILLLKKRAQA
jgi:glycerate 2-kinase